MNESPIPEQQFAVDCPRFDGSARVWASYPTREQAEAAAAQLRSVGCHVVVRGPDQDLAEAQTEPSAPDGAVPAPNSTN